MSATPVSGVRRLQVAPRAVCRLRSANRPHSTLRRGGADRWPCRWPCGKCTPRQQGGGVSTARRLRCRAPPHAVARRGSRVHESSAHWKCPLRPPLLGGANLKRVAARSSRVVAGRAGTHVFRLYSAKRSPCASFEAGQTRVRAARGSLRTALPQHRSRPGAGGVAHMLVAQREQLPPAPRGGADWTGALDAGKARSLQPTHGEKRALLLCRGGSRLAGSTRARPATWKPACMFARPAAVRRERCSRTVGGTRTFLVPLLGVRGTRWLYADAPLRCFGRRVLRSMQAECARTRPAPLCRRLVLSQKGTLRRGRGEDTLLQDVLVA